MTGSADAGRAVLEQLAPRLVPATMELSGCDACFVLEGADLGLAARALAFSLRFNGGATCITPHRVFVPRSLAPDLAHRLAEAVAAGPSRRLEPGEARRIGSLVRDALDRGADLIAGQDPPGGDLVGPIVLDRVDPGARLLREDSFGPVLALVRVADEDEALRLAADCPYALGASIFGDPRRARALADRVPAGVVQINDLIVPTADPRLPFGGRGASGFGRTRGSEGLLEMTATKVVIVRGGGAAPLRAAGRGRHGGRLRISEGGARQVDRGPGHGRRPAGPGNGEGGASPSASEGRIMRRGESGRVGVIGGGLGGLAAACTLAARGYEVTLLERNAWLGGKAAVLEAEGFRFDMGPTIMLMPSVLARIFAEAGRDLSDAIELVPIDPQWRSFFDDGTTLDLLADRSEMAAALDAFSPGGAASRGYGEFLDLSRRLSDLSDRFFFWRSIGSPMDMVDLRSPLSPKLMGEWLAMRPWSTVAATVRSFVPDRRVAQMLDHFTQYVGSAPDASPAVLCGIAAMQVGEGVWYPRGGTRAIPEALARLAAELGVELRTGCGVRSILRDDRGTVAGVEVEDGERIAFDAVVADSDAVRTHRELIGGEAAKRFERRRAYEPACSGVVLYLGLDRRYDQLLHHNFVFSRDPHAEFDSIYHRGEPADDPTCYVCAPARTEPEVAPSGGEALYVLVHAPYLRPHHDWDRLFPAYRRTILDKLSRSAGLVDLERHIVFESRLTPQDIHDRYAVLDGAIYGLASHGRLRGAFKPSNRSPDIPGLYLAGGAAHPGPGMPMVLMSGWIAADTMDRDGVVPKGRVPRCARPSDAALR